MRIQTVCEKHNTSLVGKILIDRIENAYEVNLRSMSCPLGRIECSRTWNIQADRFTYDMLHNEWIPYESGERVMQTVEQRPETTGPSNVGELIRELSYWSPDTPIRILHPQGDYQVDRLEYGQDMYEEPDPSNEDIHPETLYIVVWDSET